jgi:hypothetical protein
LPNNEGRALALSLRPSSANGISLSEIEKEPSDVCLRLYIAIAAKNWIWVTIYDLAKTTHLELWMGGRGDGQRAEVKGGARQDNPNAFDTTVQVNPRDTIFPSLRKKTLDLYFVVSSLGKKPLPSEGLDTKGKVNIVTLNEGESGHYWWDHAN